ncbi:MAG TPA: hypothetical protein PKE12_10045 [Kiritimatiellia bacterium]|nr:hypothetical protein [Kiritimatiellia bacterium]
MKTIKSTVVLALALAAGTVVAQQPDLSALMGALNTMMSGATNQAAAVEVVDFRELRAMLPEKIGDYARTKSEGEKNSAMGMTLSQAMGQYAADKANMTVKLMDYGGTGVAAMMATAWTMNQVDRESDSGYERTTEIKGHKALERHDTDARYGELQVLVAGRFMVEIEVRDGKPADLRAAAEALDLDKLSALKK